jgi:hypothetical protein
MNDEQRKKSLTLNEEVKAKEQAYEAFKRSYGIQMPKVEPVASDYVHENAGVVKALKAVISILPAILAVISFAAILISADKTFAAFSLGVNSGWHFISVALGVCGVVMTECGLIYVEFAIVRERLKKGLKRRVFNLKDIRRAVQVFIGNEQPLDYGEMPDQSLASYSRLIFVVVLAANVYGAYSATKNNADEISVFFALALGVAGAFSLRFIGAQLAHITYEIMQQERAVLMADIDRQWSNEMDRRWQAVEDEMIARAMHRLYTMKNGLAIEAGSPYMLAPGEGGELEPIPFRLENSQTQSRRE